MACYIYQLPSRVLDDLCRSMDTLSEWDWMQFASLVVTDVTQLRQLRSLERVQGASVTRELLWWWGMRQATVQQLLDLLCRLQLYRAASIVLQGNPVLESVPPLPGLPGAAVRLGPGADSERKAEGGRRERRPARPDNILDPASASAQAPPPASRSLPCEESTPGSLKAGLPSSSDLKDRSTSVPLQETLASSLFWSKADVVQATCNFDQSHRICEGTFADIYRGQRNGSSWVFKRLRETACSSPGSMERFFQAEVQICLRCRHPNVLPLRGLCAVGEVHSLIYAYMENGSLRDRLQARGGSDPLPWPQRASICSGLLRAVEHLHGLDIIHGNVKSSNVLLDRSLTPKLAHPMAALRPADGRSGYTLMETRLFQASAAYLPEDFVRVGRLTRRVDVFSCGIVLAEVLTGIPAMDKSRSPMYLKDLLLGEIASSTASPGSGKADAEKAMAREICQNHLERGAGPLPGGGAEAWAAAVCLCLRRRNASLEEALSSMVAVEERLRGWPSVPWSGLSEAAGVSSNTPEETDDVDNSGLDSSRPCIGAASPSVCAQGRAGGLPATGEEGADCLSVACGGPPPPQDARETSWKIEINEAKRKLMENILLYKEDKLDSVELFGPW
ncbi:interleukin-1 receptor-associated kinase-like 2 [Perognathus longimembris pacificus]|uniref:interleukin-1 receptor-associated kinase-like 2 n=1 Tax=Perognathus longimembris pacificus TaxID=214514 RepID=UPI002019F21C|nr:interleukin-1 receptor-associated kinase-like 2 [Perognathus longimembris pacificus]